MSKQEVEETRTFERTICDKCGDVTGIPERILTKSGVYDLHEVCLQEIVDEYMQQKLAGSSRTAPPPAQKEQPHEG